MHHPVPSPPPSPWRDQCNLSGSHVSVERGKMKEVDGVHINYGFKSSTKVEPIYGIQHLPGFEHPPWNWTPALELNTRPGFEHPPWIWTPALDLNTRPGFEHPPWIWTPTLDLNTCPGFEDPPWIWTPALELNTRLGIEHHPGIEHPHPMELNQPHVYACPFLATGSTNIMERLIKQSSYCMNLY